MKLSKNTLGILKNLSSINTNLMFRPGNKLMTVSATKSVFAEIEVEEEFPQEFGVYDLNELLGIISVFNEPELEFNGKILKIIDGRNVISYGATESAVLVTPKGSVKFPEDAEVSFELNAENLQKIVKVSSVLKVPFMTISGDGQTISVIVHDKGNENSNKMSFVVGDSSKVFKFHVKVENLKMIPDNYHVSISSVKIARFQGDKKTYVIACDIDSKFGG